jgi:hypothetical protein
MRILWVIIVSVSACAATAGYEKKLDALVGMSEVDAVRVLGVPQNVYETGSSKFFIYSRSRVVFVPGVASSYTTTMIGNMAYTNRIELVDMVA